MYYRDNETDIKGVPMVFHYETGSKDNRMVFEVLGPNLEVLFNLCNRMFSVDTVAMLAIQMLQRVRNVHRHALIHRDQKPDNYCIGYESRRNVIYLIDFGLSKSFIENGRHIPYREHQPLTGTVRYCSINTHFGIEQSRRDDMEGLGYMLVYFLKGSLPWMGIRAPTKKQRYEKILEKKLEVSVE